MRLITTPLLLTVLASVAPSSAYAAPIVFTGTDVGANSGDPRPNSDAAAASFAVAAALIGSSTLLTFETAPLGSFSHVVIAAGVTMEGDEGAAVENSPISTPDGLFGYNTTSGGSQFVSPVGALTFNFTTPIQAFGVYLSGVQFDTETITFNDGAPQTVNIKNLGIGGVQFVGFTNPLAFSSVTINPLSDSLNDVVGVDDLRFATSATNGSPVPEPASLTLLALGLAGIGARRWRQRKAS